MNKLFFLSLFIGLSILCCKPSSQNNEQHELNTLKAIMKQQEESWNEGNIEAFMQAYWQSDSLLFVGGKGAVYGWAKTLKNYLSAYSTPEQMGKLTFVNTKMDLLGTEAAFVVGHWRLDRSEDDLQGWYSLLWKKVNGEWKIVADHSSSL